MKNLTREEALELHRQMWSDMQRDLGDKAIDGRVNYKEQWCNKHFSTEDIANHCFLCEYANKATNDLFICRCCPIKWPTESKADGSCYCIIDSYYYKAPISEILALPEREDVE